MEETLYNEKLPHSIETERTLLGCILNDRRAMEDAAERLAPEDFFFGAHQVIYEAMLKLNQSGSIVDISTVSDALNLSGQLKSVGNYSYLGELVIAATSPSAAKDYIGIIEERSVMRRLIRASAETTREAMSGDFSVEDLLNNAERRVFDIAMKKSEDTLRPIKDTLSECFALINRYISLAGQLSGVPTGFSDLDRQTSGLQKSDLIVIAGRPAMGKTAFALNIATHAVLHGRKVAMFSLEMSYQQLEMRILSSEAGVSMQDIRHGEVSTEKLGVMIDKMGDFENAGLYIDDYAGASVAQIRSKCRRLMTRSGLDMIVIDYLQLMQSPGKIENRQQAVADMSRALKLLARELNIPVVVLSQLGRGPETRTDHRPIMADLRESGAIEQDADVVMLLYRPKVYDEEEEVENTTEVIIAKHRNGPTGVVKLVWRDDLMRFVSMTEREAF